MKYQSLKDELKALVVTIRTTRKTVRENMSKGLPSWKEQTQLADAKFEFRHKHIVYCLLRGRTREQIENKVVNKPNEKMIQAYLDKYRVVEVSGEPETLCVGV